MSESFDSYSQWLDIASDPRPPHHYDLLGLDVFESDTELVETAFQKRYALVRRYQVGEHGDEAVRLLQELAKAHDCLSDEQAKQHYDDELREEFPALMPPPMPARTEVEQEAEHDPEIWVIMPAEGRRWGPLVKDQLDEAVSQRQIRSDYYFQQEDWDEPRPASDFYRDLPDPPAPILAQPVQQPQPQQAQPTLPAPSRTLAPAYQAQSQRQKFPWLPVVACGTVGLGALILVSVVLALSGGDDEETAAADADSTKTSSEPDEPAPRPVRPHPITPPEPIPNTRDPDPTPVTPRPRELVKIDDTAPPGAVDLLQAIDLARDKLRGTARMENGELFTEEGGISNFPHIAFPLDPPDEYDLVADVTRLEGNNSIGFGLVVQGYQCQASVDGRGSGAAMGMIGGKRAGQSGYPVPIHKEPLLTNGKMSNVVCSVRKNAVSITVDGQRVYEWSGDPASLSLYSYYRTPQPKTMYVMSWAKFRISRLELRPVAKNIPGPRSDVVDLLQSMDLERDRMRGNAQMVDGELHTDAEDASNFVQITFPVKAPDNYDVVAEVTRTEGDKTIGCGLVVQGRQCQGIIDSLWGSGVFRIDGKRPGDSNYPVPVKEELQLTNGKKSTIVWSVRGNEISMTVDGRRVFQWSGDSTSLSLYPTFRTPQPNMMFLTAYSKYRISRLELHPHGAAYSPRSDKIAPLKDVSSPALPRLVVNSTWKLDSSFRPQPTGVPVGDVAISPDGSMLATIAPYPKNSISVRRTADWERVFATKLSPPNHCQTLAFNEDSSRFAMSTKTGKIILWRLPSGKHLRDGDPVGEKLASDLCFAPDGESLLCRVNDESIVLVREQGLTVVHTLTAPGGKLRRAIMSRGGEMIAGLSDSKLFVWSAADQRVLWESLTAKPCYDVAFAPDGKSVALRDSNSVVLVDASSGAPLRTITCPREFTEHGRTDIVFRGDGRELAIARENQVEFRSLPDGELVETIDVASSTPIQKMAMGLNGDVLAVLADKLRVYVRDVSASTP